MLQHSSPHASCYRYVAFNDLFCFLDVSFVRHKVKPRMSVMACCCPLTNQQLLWSSSTCKGALTADKAELVHQLRCTYESWIEALQLLHREVIAVGQAGTGVPRIWRVQASRARGACCKWHDVDFITAAG